MNIEQFTEVAQEHLARRGGATELHVKPHARGADVELAVDHDQYIVSKFYSDTSLQTISAQLIRVQMSHLYDELIQKVIDRNIGKNVLCVKAANNG